MVDWLSRELLKCCCQLNLGYQPNHQRTIFLVMVAVNLSVQNLIYICQPLSVLHVKLQKQMNMKPISIMIAVVVIIVVNCSLRVVSQDTSCIRQLYPCLAFLNTLHDPPPSSCCEPLKYVINYLPECLCSMMSTGGSFVAELAGINMTEVQRLPGQCGENVNFLRCLTGSSISRTDFSSAPRRLYGSAVCVLFIAMLMTLHFIPWNS